MSHVAEREMPVVEVEPQPGVGYVVYLPGRQERIALDWEDARAIVARHAPGSSLRLLPARSKEPATK